MVYKIVILPQANKELVVAYKYYANISIQVLKAFDKELQYVYQCLERNPFYPIRYKTLRGIPFKKFPYLVFYHLDNQRNLVFVYSVFHTAQNPKKCPKSEEE
jgi:mRNA-degrading endonuclease RelE of RelBE toxin-antitoxin system